jgi:hypothetical protein
LSRFEITFAIGDVDETVVLLDTLRKVSQLIRLKVLISLPWWVQQESPSPWQGYCLPWWHEWAASGKACYRLFERCLQKSYDGGIKVKALRCICFFRWKDTIMGNMRITFAWISMPHEAGGATCHVLSISIFQTKVWMRLIVLNERHREIRSRWFLPQFLQASAMSKSSRNDSHQLQQ